MTINENTPQIQRSDSNASSKSSGRESVGAIIPQFQRYRNFPYVDTDSITRCKIFTDIIPTYVIGAKALMSGMPRSKGNAPLFDDERKKYTSIIPTIGVAWLLYMILTMWGVWNRLVFLYIDKKSPIEGLNELKDIERIGIFGSYFLLDLIYPISFILLCIMYRTGVIEDAEKALLAECGQEKFEEAETDVLKMYRRGIIYCVLHITTLFIWLQSKGYSMDLVMFWSFYFGVFHVLCPVTLACHIGHVIRFFTKRVAVFRDDITYFENNEGMSICGADHISDANQLFDNYQLCRQETSKFCARIDFITDWFPLSLFLAIVGQAIAVFWCAGEWFSLVYMLLNIFLLVFLMSECKAVGETIAGLCEDIIHLPSDSILGNLDSVKRTNMLMTLQREKAIPAVEVPLVCS